MVDSDTLALVGLSGLMIANFLWTFSRLSGFETEEIRDQLEILTNGLADIAGALVEDVVAMNSGAQMEPPSIRDMIPMLLMQHFMPNLLDGTGFGIPDRKSPTSLLPNSAAIPEDAPKETPSAPQNAPRETIDSSDSSSERPDGG